MGVELALTPDLRWTVDVGGQAEAAREAGFTGLGVFVHRAGGETRRTFDDAGLRCHELLALLISKNEEATLRHAERAAAAAAVMGAPWCNTLLHVPVGEHNRQFVSRCAAILADAGSGMAVEFHPFGPVT